MNAQTPNTIVIPARGWINGDWNDGGTIRESISLYDGKALGAYCDGGEAEARAAIEAARAAFESTDWSRNHALRSRALFELADRLQERFAELASMLSREGGKLHLLPPGPGARQVVLADPPWAAVAVQLVRAL